ncbi:dihydroneopterin aldolase [Kyrpidia spormannii]|uniref:7,8-dihydroneopterin aldolase n=2 Tax=Kyrpidia spormannii TaxID=2055160 RepID=A0A2K8N283_9BACL|nr:MULTISPECIES: dihydroneopterin aldolase [Kyrpidia]HHY66265.1 dihydroneopterin aldolase [Alicyclobacillus sp.]ATY83654.1 dihydroneopterin aldolase [Kyrpidia spormannii]MCL6576399.1 dihydroneopterin aldolase [Kyrpidia sp.]CAB3389284.1 dihydroneopterin aldolase [Kyrpidia spormannii]CAB3389830.1 dihydroneopterin aldolase [Kyrpidia spormannii]
MDAISLLGMEFYAYHGVFPEEQVLGQRFIADVHLHFSTRAAGQSDDLRDTLDYAEIYRVIRETVEGKKYRLLEAVAERIADALLMRWPVEGVRVKLVKPSPPFPGTMQGVAVEIERFRNDA